MRFYWHKDKAIKDIRFGASLRGLVTTNNHPYRCLILIQEADEYLNSNGMGEYIAYKNSIRELLTPKGVLEVVQDYYGNSTNN